MNVFIIGAKGQLGRELCDCFERGYTSIGTPDILRENNTLLLADIDEVDIADMDSLRRFTAQGEIDVIINCAAYTDVPGCETNQITAMQANALGPRNLAILADELGAKLIHVSTDYVFDGEATTPYAEWDIKNPQSVYGKSKHLGEEYIKERTDRYFILRTSWLYSKYGKNFVKTMLRIAREKGACRVVSDQRGNPTYAGDLAHHILKLATTEAYGTYHATNEGGYISWAEFATEIFRAAGMNTKVIPVTTAEYGLSKAARPYNSRLDKSKLGRNGFEPLPDWQDALARYLKELENENGTN